MIWRPCPFADAPPAIPPLDVAHRDRRGLGPAPPAVQEQCWARRARCRMGDVIGAGKNQDADWVKREFDAAWAKADVTLKVEEM